MLLEQEQRALRTLSGESLAQAPRTQEDLDYWFTVGPKQRKWKAGETKEWRVRLAKLGVPENRALFLQPFIDKKPSRVEFNTAHVAAVLGTPEAFALAKKRKADFSAVWLKRTCMFIAAELGHIDFIKLLLEDGCSYEFVETKGNFAARLSPLRFAVAGRHNDLVDLLKEHAIPEDLAEAIRVGNLDALVTLKEHAELPDSFACADEKTALAVLEAFPEVSPSNLACGTPYGADLAKAIVAKHPTLNAGQLVRHMSRMSVDGLKVLFDACADLDGNVTRHSKETTLANVAMESNRVDVLRDLVERGFKPSGIKEALASQSVYNEMLTYLTELAGPMSTADFLANPYADGFKGRFEGPIFGVELGKKLGTSDAGLEETLNLFLSDSGAVEGFAFSSYMISGDAFDVISSELDARFSSRSIDSDCYRAWSGEGVNVTLVERDDDAGTQHTLTVKQGAPDTRATQEITNETIKELATQFESMFSELEDVSVAHENGELEFSGILSGSEEDVFVTWPVSPLVDGAFETPFVDTVLGEIQYAKGA
ncbi:MAG: hypothetical protein ACI9KE_003408 [Polyangiales bacterium]|jgi:hypothetical protein